MIVRDDATTFVLITQPDHAALAAELLAAIQTEPALAGPARDVILLAAREHDNGWAEVDAAPTVDPATGRPRDFMTDTASVKRALWLRGIARVATMHPHAGALVAEHAVTVYGYRRQDSDWHPFFESIAAMRDGLLRRLGMIEGPAREAFRAQSRCIQLADALSLQFCSAWSGTTSTLGYRAALDGRVLELSPDPFGGAGIPLRVPGRRIAARRYRDDADLREAMAAATPEVVVGEARGV